MKDGGSGHHHCHEREDRDALARELRVIVLSADTRQQFEIDPQ
jgi:hypothetical protein